MDDTRPVVALVLAAGRSSRFGGLKQLAEVDGKPALWHVLDAAACAGVDSIVVVVGYRRDEIITAVDHWRAPEIVGRPATSVPTIVTAENPAYRQGQSTSLRIGLGKAAQMIGRADRRNAVTVVLLADQPGVSPASIMQTVDAIGCHDVARARYLDGPSHPVVISGAVWDRLAEHVKGDAGARTLFDELDVVEVGLDARAPADIDTQEDLDRATADVRRWRARQ